MFSIATSVIDSHGKTHARDLLENPEPIAETEPRLKEKTEQLKDI